MSGVEWCGDHEGRIGLRIVQTVRDATTIWFEVGQRTVGFEAYLAPAPPGRHAEVYALCLKRNRHAWPATIAMDRRNDLYVQGRIPFGLLSEKTLDEAVGAVHQVVDLTFPSIVSIGFGREKST